MKYQRLAASRKLPWFLCYAPCLLVGGTSAILSGATLPQEMTEAPFLAEPTPAEAIEPLAGEEASASILHRENRSVAGGLSTLGPAAVGNGGAVLPSSLLTLSPAWPAKGALPAPASLTATSIAARRNHGSASTGSSPTWTYAKVTPLPGGEQGLMVHNSEGDSMTLAKDSVKKALSLAGLKEGHFLEIQEDQLTLGGKRARIDKNNDLTFCSRANRWKRGSEDPACSTMTPEPELSTEKKTQDPAHAAERRDDLQEDALSDSGHTLDRLSPLSTSSSEALFDYVQSDTPQQVGGSSFFVPLHHADRYDRPTGLEAENDLTSSSLVMVKKGGVDKEEGAFTPANKDEKAKSSRSLFESMRQAGSKAKEAVAETTRQIIGNVRRYLPYHEEELTQEAIWKMSPADVSKLVRPRSIQMLHPSQLPDLQPLKMKHVVASQTGIFTKKDWIGLSEAHTQNIPPEAITPLAMAVMDDLHRGYLRGEQLRHFPLDKVPFLSEEQIVSYPGTFTANHWVRFAEEQIKYPLGEQLLHIPTQLIPKLTTEQIRSWASYLADQGEIFTDEVWAAWAPWQQSRLSGGRLRAVPYAQRSQWSEQQVHSFVQYYADHDLRIPEEIWAPLEYKESLRGDQLHVVPLRARAQWTQEQVHSFVEYLNGYNLTMTQETWDVLDSTHKESLKGKALLVVPISRTSELTNGQVRSLAKYLHDHSKVFSMNAWKAFTEEQKKIVMSQYTDGVPLSL